MQDHDILIRLMLALLLGGAIGFERRWRGHVAGPHTDGMVAFGAALFVIVGQELGGDAAARVLAQVATGIGFLAGGVILRDGLRIRGLNTAATIWSVAAVGCLIGFGRLQVALEITALVIVGNTMFHYVEHRIESVRKLPADIDDTEPRKMKD